MSTQGNKCPVCLQLFNDPRWMPCKHIYCFKCIPKLHRRDPDIKNEIILECRLCAMRYAFQDWSTVKYYATLHCVPYLTALQFHSRSSSLSKSSCSSCYNRIDEHSDGDQLNHCSHCERDVCDACFIDHRMELKKTILRTIERCRVSLKKNRQLAQEILNQLENINQHIDFCAMELIDEVNTYCSSILAQLDEQISSEETNSSSGYESTTEPRLLGSNSSKNITLTESSIIPTSLLGKLIPPSTESSSSSFRLQWSMTYSSHPAHLVFERHSSKLFICNHRGDVDVYSWSRASLVWINTFHFRCDESRQPLTVKSFTASAFSLIVVLTSPVESFLSFYSHHGQHFRSILLSNEYISQIRCDDNYVWCLELISASLFYFSHQSDNVTNERTRFLSFKEHSFNPFRYALNHSFVAVMERDYNGTIHLFDKQSASHLKEIKIPITDFELDDVELTEQTLIYRFPDQLLLSSLDNEESLERIDVKKNLRVTVGKSTNDFLLSTITDSQNTLLIQYYVK